MILNMGFKEKTISPGKGGKEGGTNLQIVIWGEYCILGNLISTVILTDIAPFL